MSKRIILDVPFHEKEEVKALGALWDLELRKWYAPAEDAERFLRWLPYEPTPEELINQLDIRPVPEHMRAVVKLTANDCGNADWMLLELPDNRWGAFLFHDITGPASRAIFEGRYSEGCRFIADTREEVEEYADSHRISHPAPSLIQFHEELSIPDSPGGACVAELRIGDQVLKLQLHGVCSRLAQLVDSDALLHSLEGELPLMLCEALYSSASPTEKPPTGEDLERAIEISTSLREPLPPDAFERNQSCLDFIAKHSEDMTLFRVINKRWYHKLHPLIGQVRNYVRWSYARDMKADGMHWGEIANELEIKKKDTIERYIAQAHEFEQENAELLATPRMQKLIAEQKTSGDTRDLVMKEINEQSWSEFFRERTVRQLLKEKQPEFLEALTETRRQSAVIDSVPDGEYITTRFRIPPPESDDAMDWKKLTFPARVVVENGMARIYQAGRNLVTCSARLAAGVLEFAPTSGAGEWEAGWYATTNGNQGGVAHLYHRLREDGQSVVSHCGRHEQIMYLRPETHTLRRCKTCQKGE